MIGLTGRPLLGCLLETLGSLLILDLSPGEDHGVPGCTMACLASSVDYDCLLDDPGGIIHVGEQETGLGSSAVMRGGD